MEGHARQTEPERSVPQGTGQMPLCVWYLLYLLILLPTEEDPKESNFITNWSGLSVVCGVLGQMSQALSISLPFSLSFQGRTQSF